MLKIPMGDQLIRATAARVLGIRSVGLINICLTEEARQRQKIDPTQILPVVFQQSYDEEVIIIRQCKDSNGRSTN